MVGEEGVAEGDGAAEAEGIGDFAVEGLIVVQASACPTCRLKACTTSGYCFRPISYSPSAGRSAIFPIDDNIPPLFERPPLEPAIASLCAGDDGGGPMPVLLGFGFGDHGGRGAFGRTAAGPGFYGDGFVEPGADSCDGDLLLGWAIWGGV